VRRFFALVLFAVLASAPVDAATVPVIAKPSVIVYPFSASGATLDREASSRLATVMAQEIGLTGQITMLPPKPGIDRQDFLAEARAAGADYYVTGFASALGNGVALVEQVVSTLSGIVVYSNSAQVSNYREATSQGDILRDGILAHAARNLQSFSVSPAAPAGTAAPAARSNAPSAGASTPTPAMATVPEGSVHALFGRHKAASKPSPSPSPSP